MDEHDRRLKETLKLKEIIDATLKNIGLQEVIHLILNGWPREEDRLNEVKLYLTQRNDLSVHQKMLFYQYRVVIPQKQKCYEYSNRTS